ncbi:MAG: RNA-binding domain-containing protein [Methanosarcinales archaeon]
MNLKDLIKSESDKIEFKTSLSDLDRTVEIISGLANASGGKILVGVSNSGKVLGIEIGKDTIERVTNKILTNTEPKIYPKITVQEVDGKKIIVIDIKESMDKPVLAFGRPFKRVGKSTVKISKDEYERMILEKHKDKIQFDIQICEARFEDIDEEKVKWYLEKREKFRGIPKPKEMDFEDLLINIGAAKKTEKGIKLNNAGLLFFGKNPQRFIPQVRLMLVRFEGTEISRTTLDSFDCSGTLWEMLEQAEDFIRKNIRLFGFRTQFSFRRIDKSEYPLDAIREAIINALIHRDYFATPDIKVFIFDDRIEITNPGSFPEGVTPEKPMHVPRNHVLCQLMKDIGFIEKYGSGIYFMKNICKEYGIPEPKFEIDEYWTKVIFKSGGKAIVIPEIEKLGVELNDRQRKILGVILEYGKITNKEYAKIFQISRNTATNDLAKLADIGLIKRIGKGRGCYYVPKF